MARFRLFEQAPQFCDATGVPYALGSLTFYDTGTTSAKPVYTAPSGGSSLGNVLTLASDGRYNGDYWLDGEYTVLLKDADGVTIWSRDNVRDVVTGGISLPDPSGGADGDVVVVDGAGYALETILRLPDPTGLDGYSVVASGAGYELQAPAAAAAASDTVTATPGASGKVVMGDVTIQWGSDTCTGTGSLSVTKSVTFGTAFSGAPYHVSVEPVLSSGVTSNSPSGFPATRYSSPSTTGFTAGFFVGEENNGGTDTINANIPFTWSAIGPT